jgi:hypothetical protein
MLCAKPNRIAGFAVLALFGALFACSGVTTAHAQEPPTTIPAGGPPGYDPNAIAFNSWLLYPSVNFLAENSNNYFVTPTQKLSGWTYAVSPSMTAEWSNGIHTTTLYGNFQQLQYPPDALVPQESKITAPTGEATWTQQYAPLRDLNFTFVGDYTHQTLSAGLTNAIPTPVNFTGTTILPNGDIVLPNGTIVTPTGQVVGQVSAAPTVSPTSFVNPYDVFTGSANVQKLFGGEGIVNLGASFGRVDYEHEGSTDFSTQTFTENTSFWLDSVFYFYTSGSYNIRYTDPNIPSTAYRVIGGIGTRQIGLFRASAYVGYQGSGASTPDIAGGIVYGSALTYYATPLWTVSAHLDVTVNLAPSGTAASTEALNIPAITPLQVAVSNSTQVYSTSLQSTYTINPQWSVSSILGYTHIETVGGQPWDDSWLADLSLSYNMWRNLALRWEYQYSSVISNVPGTNADRTLVTMSANYKF